MGLYSIFHGNSAPTLTTMANNPAEIVSEIQAYFRARATTDRYATSPDFNLREVENHYVSRWLCDDISVLDAGCGNGYSTLCHAARYRAECTGVDFVPEMIDSANALKVQFQLRGRVEFQGGDVTDLQFPNAKFATVISQRCLPNLPSREAK